MLSHFLKLTSFGLLVLCLIWSATCLAARHKSSSANRIDITGVNEARWQENATKSVLLLINLQVFLARAHVSPGEIDGTFGENSRKAVSAFRQTRGLPPGDQLDEQLWHTLVEENGEPPLTTYTITDKDVAGPFVKRIPTDFQKEAAMERLGYTSPEELLAEKFHMSQKLLRRLNRGASFDRAGQEIVVANVEGNSLPQKIQRIEVDADKQLVLGYGKDDSLVAIYPATVGSDERPTPEGDFKVTKIAENPTYHYDPSLNFRGVHVQHEIDIPPGPNNPVGVVWISLSAEGYGIHGTPEPDKISKSASHGCVRLTNWDALELAHNISKGTPVVISRAVTSISQTGRSSVPAKEPEPVAAPQMELPPLPEQNPSRGNRQARITPPPPWEVPTQPWTDEEINAAKVKCSDALANLKLSYEPLAPIKEGLCGTPAPILLKAVGSDPQLKITPPATVDCALARALVTWVDQIVQPQAKELFASSVTRLENAGSYVCRNRYDGPDQALSEHALANAIDVSTFVLGSGDRITVQDHWPKQNPPFPSPNPVRVASMDDRAEVISLLHDSKSEFLKHVHDATCGTFETVLGPEANDDHKNHFHFDMKDRPSAFCQ